MQYNPALDGLRAVSILAVVLFHCGVPGAGGGFVGLDVFFVLSGFLITSLLVAEHRQGGISAARFYGRRALRLYPTLLLMVAVYVALAPRLWPADDRWLSAALAAFYAWDYTMAFWRLPFFTVGHTWSLGIEEKFYLLWPLVLPVLLRSGRPVAWLLMAFTAVTAWRYIVALNWTWQQAYFSFDTRMSGILLGAVAALAGFRVSRSTVFVAAAALAIAATLPSLPRWDQTRAVTLSITLAELCAFVLVCHAAEHARTPLLASRPITYIGRLSYGIYIWHFPVVLLTAGHPPWARLAITLPVAFVLAAICLRWVDMPIKRWREKSSLLASV